MQKEKNYANLSSIKNSFFFCFSLLTSRGLGRTTRGTTNNYSKGVNSTLRLATAEQHKKSSKLAKIFQRTDILLLFTCFLTSFNSNTTFFTGNNNETRETKRKKNYSCVRVLQVGFSSFRSAKPASNQRCQSPRQHIQAASSSRRYGTDTERGSQSQPRSFSYPKKRGPREWVSGIVGVMWGKEHASAFLARVSSPRWIRWYAFVAGCVDHSAGPVFPSTVEQLKFMCLCGRENKKAKWGEKTDKEDEHQRQWSEWAPRDGLHSRF